MRVVKEGSTNVSVVIRIIDSTDGTPETGVVYNTAGIDMWYRKDGALSVDITEASLSALTDAHSDGGFLHINDGYYRLDVPDAAFTGADTVMIGGTVTGMIVIGTEIQIVEYDPNDSVRLGMTALPNAAADAAGGLPISDAGGLDLDAINTNVSSILTDTAEIGAAGAGLTAVPWNATWDAEVQSEVDDALVAFFTSAAQLVDDIWDEPTSGHTTASTMGWSSVLAGKILNDTTATGTPTTTTLVLNAGSSVDDFYNDQLLYIITGTGAGQVRVISDYAGSTKTITVDEAFATTPAAADRVLILADHVHALSQISSNVRSEMDSNSTQLSAIVADTNELQGDWANGGRLDLLIDAIKAVTDLLPDSGALSSLATASSLATVDTVVDAIKAVTDLLPDSGALTSLATASALTTVDTVVDGIQTDLDNGTDGLGALKTLIDAVQTTANAVETDTQDIQSRLPAALVGGRMDSNMSAISNDTDSLAKLKAVSDSVVSGAAEAGTLSTTQMTTDLAEATADHYIGRLLTWTSGVLAGQQTDITDYDGGSGLLTFTAVTEAPSAADTFIIT